MFGTAYRGDANEESRRVAPHEVQGKSSFNSLVPLFLQQETNLVLAQMTLVDPDAPLDADMSTAVVTLKPLYVRIQDNDR